MRPAFVLRPSLATLACVVLLGCGQGAEAPAETETTAATPPADPAADATVAGTEFHATAEVPCARRAGQPTAPCAAGVVRNDDGSASVTVNWPGGGDRMIFFDAAGKPFGFDANQADGSAAFDLVATRNADLNMIAIGEERYEIPDVLVTGD